MSEEDTFENGRIGGPVRLAVDDVGGISNAEVTFSGGVTLIAGPNASNKSSLLRALAGVLGGPRPPLKSDADAGSVRMTVDGSEYHVELARNGDDVVVTGADRYTDERELCELFVALTEANPIRRAVVAGEDLYDLLMRPVDTDEIEAEIERLMAKKASLDERLDELDSVEDRLPGLRTRRDSLRTELAEVEETLRERREAVETIEAASGVTDATAAGTLDEKRDERTEIRRRIGTQEEAIDSLEAELDDIDEQLDELDAGDADGDAPVEDIEDELERLHRRKRQLTSTVNALSPVVEMNEQLLDEAAEVPDAMTSTDVVAELDPASKSVTCWTCGSTVERAQIAEQVEAVRAIVREKRTERDAVTERIRALTERKRELERRRDERDRLRTRRARIEAEIEEREDALAELRDDRRAVEQEIGELRQRVEEATDAERVSEHYDAIGDLEYERGRLTNDVEDVESEISSLEAELADRPNVEARRESIAEELRERRERIDTIERDLVNTFNEVMQEVLDALAYRSIERVWLERIPGEDRSSRTAFELHVVRTAEDGTAYDDTVDSLSKSEREVIGLVTGLAGYLVHAVDEVVPFLVVDAVEMFDADRLRGLVERFTEHADYVVAAVLPEEGAELAGAYDTLATSPAVER